MSYSASFKGGSIGGSGAIYAEDIGTGRDITISFTSSCPGSGTDVTNTSITFHSSCGPALRSAVTAKRKVNLTGTRASSGSLSNVNHQIV